MVVASHGVVMLALGLLGLASRPVQAQHSTADLVRAASAAMDARQLDSAGALLRAAHAAARDTAEQVEVLVWTAVWESLAGHDSLARVALRTALRLDPIVVLQNEALLPPRVAALLQEERQALELLGAAVLTSNMVEVQPMRLSGRPVVYPHGPWRRRVTGRAVVEGIVDTSGRFEPGSLAVVAVSDSELVVPVRVSMLAARFSPGRFRGRAVRTLVRLGIVLEPGPPPNPAALVSEARAQIATRRPDSALALLDFALDPLVNATPGVRAYALLVRGVALSAAGHDSLARSAVDSGLSAYAELGRQGIDLAPVVRHLADSLRVARRGIRRAGPRAGAPIAVAAVDEQPSLVSYPPTDYPPEMRALRVGGTVTVEVAIDTAGRIVPGTARVTRSPNPGLNTAALRVVTASVYRPARRGGKPVRVVIRQPVTFSP